MKVWRISLFIIIDPLATAEQGSSLRDLDRSLRRWLTSDLLPVGDFKRFEKSVNLTNIYIVLYFVVINIFYYSSAGA